MKNGGNSESIQHKAIRPNTATSTTISKNRRLIRPQSGRPEQLQGMLGLLFGMFYPAASSLGSESPLVSTFYMHVRNLFGVQFGP